MRARMAVLLAGVVALAYALTAFIEPWLQARGVAEAVWLRLLYAPVCHQLSERCLEVGGLAAAACARCSGLYLGGAAGLLLFAGLVGRLRVRRLWFLLAVTPTLLDVAAPWLGLPGLGNLPRFLLSLPTGLVLGLFLGVGLGDLAESTRSDTTTNHESTNATGLPNGWRPEPLGPGSGGDR